MEGLQRRGQTGAKRENVPTSVFSLPCVLIKHADRKKRFSCLCLSLHVCVWCLCVCGWEKPVASLLAAPTANELGWRPRALGPERALSPATQLSLADLQLSDYVTVAEKGPAFIHH